METYSPNFEIRPAVNQDISGIIAVHQRAFPDSLSTKLGKRYLAIFYDWFVSSTSAICFIAVKEGVVIGFVAGDQNGQYYYYHFYGSRYASLRRAALFGVIKNPLAVFSLRRALSMIYPIIKRILSEFLFFKRQNTNQERPRPEKDAPQINASLISIAVAPDTMGTKVATQLLNAFVYEATKRKRPFIQLTVNKENRRAIRFYEREGWIRSENEAGKSLQYTLQLLIDSH